MDKKKAWMGIGAVVGASLLITSAFASASNVSGYESYKTAIKNTQKIQSATADVTISVKDNGQQVLDLHSVDKGNRSNNTFSSMTTVNAGGQKKSVDVYMENGKQITKTSESDVYEVYTFDGNWNTNKEEANNPALEQKQISGIERVADTLVGNLQEYVTQNNAADGSKDISLKLTNNQIPPLVNAVASLVAVSAQFQGQHVTPEQSQPMAILESLKGQIPQLVDQIKVTDFNSQAKVGKDQRIENQAINVTITGNDAAGKAHTITIQLNAKFTNFDNTAPDRVDLNGKQVKTIQESYKN